MYIGRKFGNYLQKRGKFDNNLQKRGKTQKKVKNRRYKGFPLPLPLEKFSFAKKKEQKIKKNLKALYKT